MLDNDLFLKIWRLWVGIKCPEKLWLHFGDVNLISLIMIIIIMTWILTVSFLIKKSMTKFFHSLRIFYDILFTNHHIIVRKFIDHTIFLDMILGFYIYSRSCESILMKLLKLTNLNVLIPKIKLVFLKNHVLIIFQKLNSPNSK